jgi:hypothetical protein
MSNTYVEGMDDSAMIPEGAPGRLVGETFHDWSQRTGILPLFGPGDLLEVIDEPDYEKSLERSAEIFGGDKELYRSPDMTQEKWAAMGGDEATVTRTDEDLQLAFVESGTAAKVDTFLADPGAGVNLTRPARRITVVLTDPVRVADLPEELRQYAKDADELVEEARLHTDRILAKAEEILDEAAGEGVAFNDMPPMIDAARAYMELADRHL